MTHLFVNKETRVIENLVHIEAGKLFSVPGYEVVEHPKIQTFDGVLNMRVPVSLNEHKFVDGKIVDADGKEIVFDRTFFDEYNLVNSTPDSAPEVL